MAAQKTSSSFFSLRNIIITAAVAFIAPYLVRRILALVQGDVANVTAGDVKLAAKDSVRDAADDLNVGGMTGAIKRGAGRVADRIQQ